MTKFFIDGNSTEKHGDYRIWTIYDENRNMICKFFGPMAISCAASACEALNEGNQVNPLDARKYMDIR